MDVPQCPILPNGNFGSEELTLVCGQKLSRLLAGLGKSLLLIDVPREPLLKKLLKPPLLSGDQMLGWMIDVMSNLLVCFRPMTIYITKAELDNTGQPWNINWAILRHNFVTS